MKDSTDISKIINNEILQRYYNHEKEIVHKAIQMLNMNKILFPNYITYNNYASFVLMDYNIWTANLKLNSELTECEKTLLKALDFKENRFSYYALSELYYGVGEFVKAEKMLHKAMSFDNDINYWNQSMMGCMLYRQKRYKEARDYFLKAASLCEDIEDKTDILYNAAFSSVFNKDDLFKGIFEELLKEQHYKIAYNLVVLSFLAGDTETLKHYLNNLESLENRLEPLERKKDIQLLKFIRKAKGYNKNLDIYKCIIYEPTFLPICTLIDCPLHPCRA